MTHRTSADQDHPKKPSFGDHEMTLEVGRLRLHPARFVYGTIVIVAILPPLAADPQITAQRALGLVLGTAFVLWLSHSFSEMVATRYRAARSLSAAAVGHILVREISVVTTAIIPVTALIMSGVGWMETQTALRVAMYAGAAALFLAGWAIGQAGELGRKQSAFAALAYGALGTFIVALEVAFAH
jgi:hypothetical protein